MPRDSAPPPECAQCGADIPPRAHACPECGADERTGWREQSIYDGLDLPEPADDTTAPPPRRSGRLAWYWVVTIVAVLLLLVLSALGLR
jgi:hypothetical protein